MSAVKQISATVRSGVGKGAARAVRRAGHVPAVIYGAGKAPTPIALDANKTNLLVYAGHFLTTIFEIEVNGEKTRAIPRDYQLDPVTDRVVHVDFLRLAAGARVRLMIPVHVAGNETSPGVKRGGSVNIVSHAIELMVPADDIPEAVVVDISSLDINGSIHISEVTLPAGTKRVHSEDETLISIVPPTIVTDAAPAAAAAEAPAKKDAPGKK